MAYNPITNITAVNGVTALAGNGVTGTGSIRVTVASDNTAFATKTDLTTPGTTNGVSLSHVGSTAVASGNGVVSAGVQRVAIASDNTAFSVNATLQTGANVIGALTANQSVNVAQIAGVATATGNGVVGTGVQRVAIASDNTAFNVTSTPLTPTPSTLNSAATTNATNVKGSAGTVYGITCSNAGAAAAFVKLYNKATAPTVGTDVPVITIPIPASSVVSLNLGITGHRFATGIGFAITNLVADSDTTAVAANQVKVMMDYV